MTAMDPFDPAPYPEFAHQVAARLARVAQEDREAVAGSLRRLGFQIQGEPDRPASYPTRSPGKAADTRTASRRCDFRYASPISVTSRQRADMRIPHLAVSHVTRTAVPRSADGATHDRYPARSTVAAEHFDYLTDGARTTYRTHFDYITRRTGPIPTSPFVLTGASSPMERRATSVGTPVAAMVPAPGSIDSRAPAGVAQPGRATAS